MAWLATLDVFDIIVLGVATLAFVILATLMATTERRRNIDD